MIPMGSVPKMSPRWLLKYQFGQSTVYFIAPATFSRCASISAWKRAYSHAESMLV